MMLGFDIHILESVYSPREDTLLLAKNIPKGKKALEIGCGSGLVSLCAAKKADSVLGVDINPVAVRCASENAKRNKVANCTFKVSALFSAVSGRFDVILFNAPYLPKEGKFDEGIEALAWCGGNTGREAIAGFLDGCGAHLNPKGAIAVILSSITGLDEVLDLFRKNGFAPFAIVKEKIPFEELYCIHARKSLKASS